MTDRLAFSGLVTLAGGFFFCLGCLIALLFRMMWPTTFTVAFCCAILMAQPVTSMSAHGWSALGIAILVGFLLSLMLRNGLLTVWKLWRATRHLIQTTHAVRLPQPPVVTRLASRLGLTTALVVVPDRKPFSFCYGLWQPRICLSLGLIDLLTEAELEAVLWHEAYHLRRREPLRMVIALCLSRIFFFIPLLAELRDHYLTEKELAADTAAEAHTSRAALAGALYKLLTLKTPFTLPPMAAAAGLSVTAQRVDRLLTPSTGTPWTPSGWSIWSALAIFTFGCLLMVIVLG